MNEKEMAACWATLRKALEDGKNDPITIISECCTGFLFVMDGVERRLSEMSKAVTMAERRMFAKTIIDSDAF